VVIHGETGNAIRKEAQSALTAVKLAGRRIYGAKYFGIRRQQRLEFMCVMGRRWPGCIEINGLKCW
jgi:hypothetical protein